MKKSILSDRSVSVRNEQEEMTLVYELLQYEEGPYGIQVTKHKNGVFRETNETGAICYDGDKTYRYMQILARNQITPYVLAEVVDDTFLEWMENGRFA